MRNLVSSGPTSWITSRLHDFGIDVGSVIPSGFEAYARVFHPARNNRGELVRWREIVATSGRSIAEELQYPGFMGVPARSTAEATQLWNEKPDSGNLPLLMAQRIVGTLLRHTRTPEKCWFAVWEGFADLQHLRHKDVAFSIPGARRFFLMHGAVAEVMDTLSDIDWIYRSPNIWWPDDRTWCVATEIDFPWTYVGGSAACIQAILDDAELEALPTSPDEGNHMQTPERAAELAHQWRHRSW